MPQLFAVPIFLIVFRETVEVVLIVSILLAWLKQSLGSSTQADDRRVYRRLVRQVWLGTGLGFSICLVAASVVIGIFYSAGTNHWSKGELYYEGAFAILASLIITVVGAALLRVSKLQAKWRVKLAAALEEGPALNVGAAGAAEQGWATKLRRWSEKYALFVLPFVTVMREGIEAIIFVAGVSFSAPASAFPLPAITGLAAGSAVGYLLYRTGTTASLQVFLVASTCLLYLVAAGLFSRGVGYFEQQQWNAIIGGDAAELGSGPGTYDIDKVVWHVNCCNPSLNGGGGWGVFQAILGWNNTATYGAVISYFVYWIVVIAGFLTMRFKEVKGHWPFISAKKPAPEQERLSEQMRPSLSSGSPSEDIPKLAAIADSKTSAVAGETHGIKPVGSK